MNSAVVPWSDYSPDQVENLAAAWLTRTVDGAQRIDGAGGDDGVDVRAPAGDGYHIFEIKSFHERLTGGQKTQIRNSLLRAVDRQPDMVRWTLVLPLDLTPAEIRWFDRTLRPVAPVPIGWIGRTALEAGLSERPDLLRAFAPGSAERRALELLGDYHAEQAGLARGMADGVERTRRLRKLFDVIDPDWTFDIATQGENITVDVHAKDREAAQHQRLQLDLSIDAAKDAVSAQAYEQFMKYGRPADIPSGSISDFKVDLPGNLNELIAAGTTPSISIRKAPEEMIWRLDQRIEAVRSDRVIASLPVEWTDRSIGPLGGTWLSGRDRSGFLELMILSEPDGTGGITIRSGAIDDLLPDEALPTLRFLSKLQEADRIRLRSPDHPVTEMKVTGDMVLPPKVLENGILVAEILARIQAATETIFPLPTAWTAKDFEMMYFYDRLLSHGQVEWYWPDYSTNIPVGSIVNLLSQAVLPRVSMGGTSGSNPTIVELVGHRIPLPGELRCVVENLILMNPRLLRQAVKNLPPELPVLVDLGHDDRTTATFFLDRDPESERADADR